MPNLRKYKHNMGLKFIMGLAFYCVFCVSCLGGDFFSIKSVRFFKERNDDGVVVKKVISKKVSSPFLELRLSFRESINSNRVFAKVYFYDKDKKLLATINTTSPAYRNEQQGTFTVPTIFKMNKVESIFFRIPESFSDMKDTVAIVVVGDDKSASVSSYLKVKDIDNYPFPEKNLTKIKSKIQRAKDISETLGKSLATISNDIKRNSCNGAYDPQKANKKYLIRLI